jgi:farnesyl diphosphate synthase
MTKAIPSLRDFSDLNAAIAAAARDCGAVLDLLLPKPEGPQARVHEAMRYSIFAGGKRLRPFLLLASAELFGADRKGALRAAAAIEALHTYSLVHDDLPCMDDDDLRRGRPTAHRAFDEATAVLAGDGLLTIAFEILCGAETHPSAETRCLLALRLAEAGGTFGMIGGQMIDMRQGEGAKDATSVINLQRMKTGALFEFSCMAGPILAGAGPEHGARLQGYARDFGLAFQITDDLLDALGNEEKTGKAVGKDKDQGKTTLISLYGVERAREEAERVVKAAVANLEPYGQKASKLCDLAFFLLDRES